ncbi:hypothetical protein TSOC_007063 [Tetrabaena socialis]|uniref:Ankyrin repeat domain-containing protein n=1 Tax=Tetrabaena socialis TaxID=47790 RepID=A0A2J8A217_9CHLO|nr:hypothetical protein TSOC_007063 [Tetrabaena socialis]|eukprot:PNH06554.1 hypothetical protein TSOC_007063 [Tetrabaena socialis]
MDWTSGLGCTRVITYRITIYRYYLHVLHSSPRPPTVRFGRLLPLLEVVGTANKAFAKVAKFMNKYGQLAMFPVKVQVPLMLTVYMLLSFKQFQLMGAAGSLPVPDDSFFELPAGYTETEMTEEQMPGGGAGGRAGKRGVGGEGGDGSPANGAADAEGAGAKEASGGKGARGGKGKAVDGEPKLTLLKGSVMEEE